MLSACIACDAFVCFKLTRSGGVDAVQVEALSICHCPCWCRDDMGDCGGRVGLQRLRSWDWSTGSQMDMRAVRGCCDAREKVCTDQCALCRDPSMTDAFLCV
eukprot:2749988-Rhodomonas_salina.2